MVKESQIIAYAEEYKQIFHYKSNPCVTCARFEHCEENLKIYVKYCKKEINSDNCILMLEKMQNCLGWE